MNHLHNIKLQDEGTNPDVKVSANYPADPAKMSIEMMATLNNRLSTQTKQLYTGRRCHLGLGLAREE